MLALEKSLAVKFMFIGPHQIRVREFRCCFFLHRIRQSGSGIVQFEHICSKEICKTLRLSYLAWSPSHLTNIVSALSYRNVSLFFCLVHSLILLFSILDGENGIKIKLRQRAADTLRSIIVREMTCSHLQRDQSERKTRSNAIPPSILLPESRRWQFCGSHLHRPSGLLCSRLPFAKPKQDMVRHFMSANIPCVSSHFIWPIKLR